MSRDLLSFSGVLALVIQQRLPHMEAYIVVAAAMNDMGIGKMWEEMKVSQLV
jgi:hypothetical protein